MLKPALKRLSARLYPRSLKIKVAGEFEVFRNVDEFARFLQARLEVPAHRVEGFAAMDERSMRREIRKALQAHQNAADVMVHAAETGESIAYLWRRLDISKVPDDHDWPSILFSVGNAGNSRADYQRTALSQYISYLDARREVLDSLQHGRPDHGEHQPETPASVQDKVAESAAVFAEGYIRLQPRHAMDVNMEERAEITIVLGSNRFHLERRGGDYALDEGEAGSHALRAGRNTVGRSSQCDVCLDKSHMDVSRQHLIIEIIDAGHISLMDVSSRGTYVRPDSIEHAGTDHTIDGSR